MPRTQVSPLGHAAPAGGETLFSREEVTKPEAEQVSRWSRRFVPPVQAALHLGRLVWGRFIGAWLIGAWLIGVRLIGGARFERLSLSGRV